MCCIKIENRNLSLSLKSRFWCLFLKKYFILLGSQEDIPFIWRKKYFMTRFMNTWTVCENSSNYSVFILENIKTHYNNISHQICSHLSLVTKKVVGLDLVLIAKIVCVFSKILNKNKLFFSSLKDFKLLLRVFFRFY